jgi:hypothetical protein
MWNPGVFEPTECGPKPNAATRASRSAATCRQLFPVARAGQGKTVETVFRFLGRRWIDYTPLKRLLKQGVNEMASVLVFHSSLSPGPRCVGTGFGERVSANVGLGLGRKREHDFQIQVGILWLNPVLISF